MVTAVGIAAAVESDATAADVDANVRLGVLPNQPPIDCHAGSEGDEALFAALMAVAAADAAASPTAPGENVTRILAVNDPGVTSTTAPVAPGYCASTADCIVATSAVVNALVNVI